MGAAWAKLKVVLCRSGDILRVRTVWLREGRGPLRLDLRAELNRPSTTLSNSALLHPRRSRATWENAGLHGGERVIADKDEVPGSTPGRPTKSP